MLAGATALLLHLGTPQALDLLFAALSLALFALYHAWYYSWHLWPASGWGPPPALGSGSEYHRLDMTGQTARRLFTQAVLTSGTDADYNLAVQVMRNPITAASILGTGASVGVTTLINVILDKDKMDVVRDMSRRDPLTGGSSVISPETKLGTAVAALFLSFFSLAQALRLFVHFPFMVRAAHQCQVSSTRIAGGDTVAPPAGEDMESHVCLWDEAVRTCLRSQTFFSLGLRFLYLFIPLVAWTMGGTWLLAGTILEVFFLYALDQL